jgi:hypothetical protein
VVVAVLLCLTVAVKGEWVAVAVLSRTVEVVEVVEVVVVVEGAKAMLVRCEKGVKKENVLSNSAKKKNGIHRPRCAIQTTGVILHCSKKRLVFLTRVTWKHHKVPTMARAVFEGEKENNINRHSISTKGPGNNRTTPLLC